MTRFRSPRLLPYGLMVSGASIGSLALGRLEPLLIAAPFLVVLLAAVALSRTRPRLSWQPVVSRDRVLEGDQIDLGVRVSGNSRNFEVGFVVGVPPGMELLEAPATEIFPSDLPRSIQGRFLCTRWGARTVGGGVILARDAASAFVYQAAVDPVVALRVYPRPERLRSVLRPHMLRPRLGGFVSRASGVGLEFAAIRQFTHGDQRRHINWKATARQQRLHVNLFHPERSADLVLVLDAFSDVAGPRRSSLDMAVSSATALAMQCLRRRDRVGLVSIGGAVRWLLPGTGIRQLYRIVDSLMRTELILSYAWQDASAIPPPALPPGALVLALTPLADRRAAAMLIDLKRHGHDVSVVEIAAEKVLPDPETEREQLARRMWSLHREAVRSAYLRLGLPVVEWEPGQPLQIPVVQLERFRRRSRRVYG